MPAQWSLNTRAFDFYDAKGDVERLLNYFKVENVSYTAIGDNNMLHPGQSAKVHAGDKHIGYVGMLHPKIGESLSLPKNIFVFDIDLSKLLFAKTVVYQKVSKYPMVKRDLSLIMDKSTCSEEVRQLIFGSGGAILKEVNIIDRYQGDKIPDAKVSLAFSLMYQEIDRTLTDDEIEQSINNILQSLAKKGISLRESHGINEVGNNR